MREGGRERMREGGREGWREREEWIEGESGNIIIIMKRGLCALCSYAYLYVGSCVVVTEALSNA